MVNMMIKCSCMHMYVVVSMKANKTNSYSTFFSVSSHLRQASCSSLGYTGDCSICNALHYSDAYSLSLHST